MESIDERVRRMIRDYLGVNDDQISPSASFCEDLEADPVDFVDLIMHAEDVFGIDITDEAALKLTTVGKFIEYVENATGNSDEVKGQKA